MHSTHSTHSMQLVLRLRSQLATGARRARPYVTLFVLVNAVAYMFYSLPLILSVALLVLTPPSALVANCFLAYARIRYLIEVARVGDIVTVWSPLHVERPLALMALGTEGPRSARGLWPWGRFEFGRYAIWRYDPERAHESATVCAVPFEGLRVREAGSGADPAAFCMLSGCVTAFSTRSTLMRTSWADVCEVVRRTDPGAGYSMPADEHLAMRGRFDAAARTVQRAWRSRALGRKRAARVIEDAVLHAMYRPGGWRLGAVLDHWRRLAAPEGTQLAGPETQLAGPEMV